jgi:hypothetical protein
VNSIFSRGLTLALALVVGACSDNPTDIIEGDALTQAEAAALAEVVAATLFSTWETASGPPTAPARASGTFQFQDQLPCELGGSVAVSGSLSYNVDDESGDGTLNFSLTGVHSDCQGESQDGIALTLNGAPNITASFSVVSEGDAIAFSGGYDGAVEWATGEKSGTCSVDVDFSLTGNVATETGSASLQGRVCGITFSHSLQLT